MTLPYPQLEVGDLNDLLDTAQTSQCGTYHPCAAHMSFPYHTLWLQKYWTAFLIFLFFILSVSLSLSLILYCFLYASPFLVYQENFYSTFRTQLRHHLPGESFPWLSIHSEFIYPPQAPTGPWTPLLFLSLSSSICLLLPLNCEHPEIKGCFTYIPISPLTELNKLPST